MMMKQTPLCKLLLIALAFLCISVTATAQTLDVSVTYEISNDCGLPAEETMNPTNGNTLKEGLIAATTAVTIDILNTTFTRDDEGTRRNANLRRLNSSAGRQSSSHRQRNRNLVYFTDDIPVTIDRVFDIETGCASGSNCLLVVSSITVVLEPSDDPEAVHDAILDAMTASFDDNSFFLAIPEDTVICPA